LARAQTSRKPGTPASSAASQSASAGRDSEHQKMVDELKTKDGRADR
jgi:hypothetical protein